MSITRPPQVTLSSENIARLMTYPRPPQDNGIGLHFHVDLSPELIQRTVTNLKSIRATWTMIYAQDEQLAERAAVACFRAGIMPVVRIGKLIDEGFDPVPYVHGLRRALAASDFPHDPARPPLYVQVYNEPEDWREWMPHDKPPGWQMPSNWPQIFGRNWAQQAVRIYDAGGYPGIQVLDRPGFDVAVDAIAAMGRQDIWQRAFFVHHNYGENHPPDYPYDARNQQDNPGRTILDDYICALKFQAHASWMQERLGFVLPLIGGEGGWLPGAEEDRRYPKVEPALHARYTVEMFQWLRSGVLSNGQPLPDYLFSITAWIAGSWTFQGQNWWDNPLFPDGKLTQTIEAMQAIEPFERRFSWQGATPPPPVDPTPPPPVDPTPPPVDPTPPTPVEPTPPLPPQPLPALRKGDWIEPFHIEVVRNENRPDRPQGEIVYRLVDLWTTRDSSWEPNPNIPGSVPAWARDAYLRPSDAPDYFDDAGADHHLFARVLDLNGNPVTSPDLVMLWSDGLHQLADPGYRGYVRITPKSHSGWANQDIYARYDHTRGDRGPWCWCPAGAADVVTGGGLPGMGWHVSTFAVWQAERRQAVAPPTPPVTPPTPPVTPPTPPVTPPTPPVTNVLEAIRRSAWDSLNVPFNPDAAIGSYARANNLGVPMTGEFDVAGHRCQGFVGGIVYVPIGQWDQVRHITW